jgi:phosphotransferase system IIA component
MMLGMDINPLTCRVHINHAKVGFQGHQFTVDLDTGSRVTKGDAFALQV